MLPSGVRGVSSPTVHVVILGCGRVGASLAHALEARGHSVAVIDRNREAFRRLGSDFQGETVTGTGFDRDTLIEAGIERAGAFAAVSSGDNSNIIAARVARETFAVAHVVARIYDPGRAEIYQRLGIPTVATVVWTADQVIRRLLPEGSQTEWRDASGGVRLAEVHVHEEWYGKAIHHLERATRARVAFITRMGHGVLPSDQMVLQEGDQIHLLMADDQSQHVEAILAKAPEAE
jgi:trk system potassium uptake protein